MFNPVSILATVAANKVFDNIFGGRTSGTDIPPSTRTSGEPSQAQIFGETLNNVLTTLPRPKPEIGSNIGVDVYSTVPVENKTSGQKVVRMLENGPMQAGAVLPFAQQAARQIGRTIFGGGAGGAVGGAVTGFGIGSMFAGNGDACGCEPKPFVRLDKCGRPIITRAMQAKAKDMVQNCGMEAAAQMLGVDIQLLGEIAFKKFKPRAKGISGAQLKTAKRVARQMHMAQKQFKKACMGR